VTFERHQDLFNFQNSPLFILLIRGSEAPAGEALWHLSLSFETDGLGPSQMKTRKDGDRIGWGVEKSS
jgi:hypothetical protein